MTKADLALLAQAALASGVPVRKIEPGVNALGLTDRDWAFKVREPKHADAADSLPRAAAVDHLGRTWYKNAEGEVLGHG